MDDEQVTQKLNARIESMEVEIASLRNELEKLTMENDQLRIAQANRATRHSPTPHGRSSSPVPGATINHHEEVLANELHKQKQINQELKAQLEVALQPKVPPHLLEAFSRFAHRTSIPVELSDKHHQEENCVKALQIASQQLLSLKKQVDEAPPSGSDSELAVKVKNLQEELRLALNAAEDIRALKAKILQMTERIRSEKEGKLKAEEEVASARKNVQIMLEQIEKLMKHMRHEAAVKTRLVKQLQDSQNLVKELKNNYALILKKNAAKDRFILELHEGSRVLEDQLRLMDEKYLDLRTKLDWARDNGYKKLQKAEKTASELRAKFSMLTGNATVLLDNMAWPEGFSPDMAGDAQSVGSFSSLGGQKSLMSASLSLRSGGGMSRRQGSKSRGSSGGKRLEPLHRSVDSGSLVSRDGSVNTTTTKEPTIDSVLEKIKRKQEGMEPKRDWTEDSVRQLVHTH